MKAILLLLFSALVVAACSGSTSEETQNEPSSTSTSDAGEESLSSDPEPATDPGIAAVQLVTTIGDGIDTDAIRTIIDSGDERYAWLLSDFLRFVTPGDVSDTIVSGIERAHRFQTTRRPDPVGGQHQLPDRTGHSGTAQFSILEESIVHVHRTTLGTLLRGPRQPGRFPMAELGRCQTR